MSGDAREPTSPTERYQDGVRAQRWKDDPAQARALAALEERYRALACAPAPPGHDLIARLRGRLTGRAPQRTRGLYLWGPVGRGKTFLMDLFAASLPSGVAMRRHFHRFMGEVHTSVKQHAREVDPLVKIAAEIARRARVLCLDEFLVEDIGDAMILHGLLRGLFRHGVVLVTTSNTPPAELYRDGLQRARFEPAIALLEQHCQVLELASGRDWRLRTLEQARIYQSPPGAEAERALARVFDDFARGDIHDGGCLAVHDRPIGARRRAENIAWFDFDALCDGPRSRADYTDLAARFAAVVVSGVPVFTPGNHDAAKRFIQLVDALYDRRVKLVLSAAAPIVDLYEGDRLRAEFARTESRLIEMQSEDYLALAHQ